MTPDLIERLRSVVGVKPLIWSQSRVFGVTKRRGSSPASFGEWTSFAVDDLAPEQIAEKEATAQADYEVAVLSALIPVEPVPTPREAELEEALRPFASVGEAVTPQSATDDSPWATAGDATPYGNQGLTFGDFRRARLALNPTHGKEPKE